MKNFKFNDTMLYIIVAIVAVVVVINISSGLFPQAQNKSAYTAQTPVVNPEATSQNPQPQSSSQGNQPQAVQSGASQENSNSAYNHFSQSSNEGTNTVLTAKHSGTLIINHNNTNAYIIPASYIQKAKNNLKVFYGHTSHGSQITSGMEAMNSEPYTYNSSGAGGALKYMETGGDLGHNGDLTWAQTTRQALAGNPDINVVMWSWCAGCSDNTIQGINAYLNEMSRLEREYPKVTFIYMTGHLDGTGTGGNLNRINQQIRDYCMSHNKVLYDFADIESYDPSGKGYLALGADDGCNYQGRNWAQEWISKNPANRYRLPGSAAHTHPLNAALKGNAFWVMMAKLVGWQG